MTTLPAVRIQRGLSGFNRILTLRAPVRTSGSRSTGYFEEDISGKTDIISYVLKMREKIAATAAMAQCVQGRQKAWYDRCARTRCFQPGEKVLLLLPSSENKLLAIWQGPYSVTYEVHMPDRRRKHQVFHVNMLKK